MVGAHKFWRNVVEPAHVPPPANLWAAVVGGCRDFGTARAPKTKLNKKTLEVLHEHSLFGRDKKGSKVLHEHLVLF